LIKASTKTWRRDGLLVTRNGWTRKTEVFEHLWDSAVETFRVRASHFLVAQSLERSIRRGGPGNKASSVDFDSTTAPEWSPDDRHSRKRRAASVQPNQSSSSAKRARVEQSDVRDSGGDSMDVDSNVFVVTSRERDLADENTRHMTTVPAAPPLDRCPQTDGNIPVRCGNVLETTVMTAREALLALDPAEERRGSLKEGIQLLQEEIGPGCVTEPRRDPGHVGCFICENDQTNAISLSLSQTNQTSSAQPAAIAEAHDHATSTTSNKTGPHTTQLESSSKEGLPSTRQTSNGDLLKSLSILGTMMSLWFRLLNSPKQKTTSTIRSRPPES